MWHALEKPGSSKAKNVQQNAPITNIPTIKTNLEGIAGFVSDSNGFLA